MPVSSALFVFPLYKMAFLYQVNDQLKGGLFRYLRMQCGSTPFKRSTLSGLACKCYCTQFRYYKGQKKVKGLSHNKETKQISYAYHLKQKRNSFASRIDNSLKILLNYALVSIKTKNRLCSPTTTETKKQTSSKNPYNFRAFHFSQLEFNTDRAMFLSAASWHT